MIGEESGGGVAVCCYTFPLLIASPFTADGLHCLMLDPGNTSRRPSSFAPGIWYSGMSGFNCRFVSMPFLSDPTRVSGMSVTTFVARKSFRVYIMLAMSHPSTIFSMNEYLWHEEMC